MRKLLENKTVLFISPVFYGYEKIISEQLKKEGATVIFYPERENGLKYKMAANFKTSTLIKHQENYYLNIFKKIKDLKIDYLFVIRGFLMPVKFIDKIRSHFSNPVLIMHQWDSMKNNNYEIFLTLFDKIFSFDPLDCSNYPVLKYLPNFYLPEYTTLRNLINERVSYDISFVGWAYKNRLSLIKKITQQLPDISFFRYLYIPFAAYLKNILKGIYLPGVKFTKASFLHVFKIFQQSFSILDIADEDQSGYTYRTIDAMAAGKKLITTNAFIQQEKFYNESNILIIDRYKPIVNADFFKTPFKPVDIEAYSLNNWVKNIFSETGLFKHG